MLLEFHLLYVKFSDSIALTSKTSVSNRIDIRLQTVATYLVLASSFPTTVALLHGLPPFFATYRRASELHVPIAYALNSSDNPLWIAFQNRISFYMQHRSFRIHLLSYATAAWVGSSATDPRLSRDTAMPGY